jgi:dihydrofolate synthase/folylpolyglutamate synthase
MTYHNAIKYVKNSPKSAKETVRFERIRLLCKHLGDPQKSIRYIRLAGSNGKTLCGGMLTSILKKAGIHTGYLAMPPRDDIRANIVIDTQALSMDDTVRYTTEIIEAVNRINEARRSSAISEDGTLLPDPEPFVPTSSEILFAMALVAFRDKNCKLCLIESDHEGYDPSLFMPAPFSAIICGTIPSEEKKEIARIRSYITRGVQEIVSAPQDQAAHRVLSDTCASVNCRLTLALKSAISVEKLTLRETEFSYKGNSYTLSLCGRFQIVNATVVLETVEMLARRGFEIPHEAIIEGLSSLNIPSKFEVLSVMPLIIADSTHTPVAIETVCDSMMDFKQMTGSDVRLCLPEGELIELYTKALTNRGYNVTEVISLSNDETLESREYPCPVTLCKTIKTTVKTALDGLKKDTVLLISGKHTFTENIRYELLQRLGF